MRSQKNITQLFIAIGFSLQIASGGDACLGADDRELSSQAFRSSTFDDGQPTDLVGRTGIGTRDSGWVNAQVDLNPTRNPSGLVQGDRNSRGSVLRMVSDTTISGGGNVLGDSVLESGTPPQVQVDQTNPLNDGFASSNTLPPTALVAPSNSRNQSANSGDTVRLNSGVNPLSEIAGGNQTNTMADSGSVDSGNAFGFGRGRFAEWVRSFPLFQLNQSTGTSSTAVEVWQERVRSFVQAPDVASQPRQGLFSALMPKQNPLGSSASVFRQPNLQSGSGASALPATVQEPFNTQSQTSDSQATTSHINQSENGLNQSAESNSGSLQLNGLRGNSGWFPFQGMNRQGYQAFSGFNQGNAYQAQHTGASSGTAQSFGANNPGVYAANQVPNGSPGEAPKQGCWNQFWGRWFGTGYRTTSFRVPVTYYRPVITTDPTTGQQVVVQQPCTSFVQQQQRTPTRFFRSARPRLGTDPSLVVPLNECPPSYAAAMPGVVYPGLGYVVAANPSQGVQHSSYVMAVNGLQQVAFPMGMTIWNGTVLPASATLVRPSTTQAQPFGSSSDGSTGVTNQAIKNGRPLTGEDLREAGQMGSPPSSSDLTPMKKPRLESFRYSPSQSPVAPKQDLSNEISVTNQLGFQGNDNNVFSAPPHVGGETDSGSRSNRTAVQWRLQNASDSTALLKPPAKYGAARADWQSRREGERPDVSNSNDASNAEPSLEDLLRSENFVGAEPIAAPQDFRPRYPRRDVSNVRSMSQSAILGSETRMIEQVAAERESTGASTTHGPTTISARLPSVQNSFRDVARDPVEGDVVQSRWIRQPNTSR